MTQIFIEIKISNLTFQLPYKPDIEMQELGTTILKFILKRWEDLAIKDSLGDII